MKKLSKREFEKLIEDARILSKDKHGLKVLESRDRKIFKLFRLKRSISSARWHPYAMRFYENATLLLQRQIPTVKVLDTFVVPEIKRDIVVYEPLEGKTMREQTGEDAKKSFEKLPAFLSDLHAKGIFFRSIHFGNIIVQPDGSFGLIDVSDLKVRRWRQLWGWERARNFKHFTKYQVDRNALSDFGFERFVTAYLDACGVRGIQRSLWQMWVTHAVKR